MNLQTILLEWYGSHKRELPWRKTTDPYRIWISEVLLQQTRINQGIDFYQRFIDVFPDIRSLAVSDEEDVLKVWQGLGYYSRARHLHEAAKYVFFDLNNCFPNNFNDLLKMKGIGTYTAGAIASIAFGEPVPVVDGNVFRLMARYFGINTVIDSNAGNLEFADLAKELLDKENPGRFNQALMEFGALQCKPINPDCVNCPFSEECYAFKHNCVNKLPVRKKKNNPKSRFFNYLLIKYQDCIFINKRTGNDIWKNLFELPLVETKDEVNPEGLMKTERWKEWMTGSDITVFQFSTSCVHRLSHQKLFANFYCVEIASPGKSLMRNFIMILFDDVVLYPWPRLIGKYLGT